MREAAPEGWAPTSRWRAPGATILIGAIAACEAASRYVSRHLVREILDETEAHVDRLDAQLEPIEKIRLQNHPRSAV